METYHNLVSSIDVDRHEDNIEVLHDINLQSHQFLEFMEDMMRNDAIELNLIKNGAYTDAVMLNLTRNLIKHQELHYLVAEQQRNFGGSKLFYFNDGHDKILVLSVAGGMQQKLAIIINRLNKVNEKVHRLNSKIRKENTNAFLQKHASAEEKDVIINLINRNLKV